MARLPAQGPHHHQLGKEDRRPGPARRRARLGPRAHFRRRFARRPLTRPMAAATAPAKRLLLVSYYFPPYSSMAAIRLGKLAKHFTARGWDVRALSAHGHERQALALEIPAERVVHTP